MLLKTFAVGACWCPVWWQWCDFGKQGFLDFVTSESNLAIYKTLISLVEKNCGRQTKISSTQEKTGLFLFALYTNVLKLETYVCQYCIYIKFGCLDFNITTNNWSWRWSLSINFADLTSIFKNPCFFSKFQLLGRCTPPYLKYLGSDHKHLAWLKSLITTEALTVFLTVQFKGKPNWATRELVENM